MEDNDIIAYVYPHGVRSEVASKAIETSSRCVGPRIQSSRSRYNRGERQSTEPPESQGASDLDYLPCLMIRFSEIPRTDHGLVFGSNNMCDIVLDTQGMSNCHFSLTFDNEGRLVVKDLKSLVGTEVTYDGQGVVARSEFRWIVGGHRIPLVKTSIVIKVQKTVSFQIVVPYHNISSSAHLERVNRFRQGAATAEELFGDLGVSNSRTRVATGSHTPGTGEIHLTKRLGEGAFGVVTHLWNVSTGSERVVKEPTAKAIQTQRPHIVELLSWSSDPYPQLYLEYIPRGSLDDHEGITYNETLTIVRQCLSALAHLHGSETPIAHRDIKPANILVQYRSQGSIYVKLGDFGLSRDSSELVTICGTPEYLAPEIYHQFQARADHERQPGYTTAVDIWSLGVVACELIYGLPRYRHWHTKNGVAWCEEIVRELQSNMHRRPNGLGQSLLPEMVVLSQESRLSASHCYDRAVALSRTEDGGPETSTPGSCTEEGQQATLRYTAEEAAATVLWHPRPWRDSDATNSSNPMMPVAPEPETFSSLSRVTQSRDGASGASEAPPSSAVRRYTGAQQDGEYHHFVHHYSPNPIDPLYVGSSLASELGGEHPKDDNKTTEGGDSTGPDENEEMEQAALLLQDIAQEL